MSKAAACRALLGATKRQTTKPAVSGCLQCRIDLSASCLTRASSSNSRWKMRQGRDMFAREAKVQGLKSRAAFKLLEMDAKYKLFRKGQTVVDLGYAPGSWSQVAVERTKPNGQILGIDIIPAQPPKGVSTIQGNFLSPDVQDMVKEYLSRAKSRKSSSPPPSSEYEQDDEAAVMDDGPSYIDMERAASETATAAEAPPPDSTADGTDAKKGRLVDVVLSDMSAPWDQTSGFGVNSLSNPYSRMMNTSGMAFRDHAGSMDLCGAALQFANDTLRNGGHFICKFYQGSEDKAFEKKLKTLFAKVFREKPESSRSDSKEAYFVALRRKGNVQLERDESL
ncbi:FtsJ-like methyltransferase [Colletotrichum zoysiae]|uniref:rRNA methyltransferase 2, mitochondrial n=1 Tax=Colletotrichum zoysiae TaxID=1216348 RepID=A0AAD9H7F4_9PEZI|nr:FtsJ-like methyltransferase [Colletotrichum zoysiae]